jgi:hypothetical protein
MGDVAQQREALVAQVTLYEQITGKEITLLLRTLTVLEGYHVLPWDEHLRYILAEEG